jgi:hypothetical protein
MQTKEVSYRQIGAGKGNIEAVSSGREQGDLSVKGKARKHFIGRFSREIWMGGLGGEFRHKF